jgi:hypothetical protein
VLLLAQFRREVRQCDGAEWQGGPPPVSEAKGVQILHTIAGSAGKSFILRARIEYSERDCHSNIAAEVQSMICLILLCESLKDVG